VQPAVPVELGNAVEKISASRTWSEFVARDAASYKVVKPAYYGTVMASYTDAQAAFNAWIDRLKFAVDNGDDLSAGALQEGYRKSLTSAAEKSALLRKYYWNNKTDISPGLRAAGVVPGIEEIAKGVIQSLIEGGFLIWKELDRQKGEAKTAARERVKRALEEQKYKPFEDVVKDVLLLS